MSTGLGALRGAAGLGALRRQGRAVLAYDTFSRADSATTLGKAESGQTWVANSGTVGVQAGQAYAPASGYAQRNINVGASDYAVEADVLWRTGDSVAVCLRGKSSGTDRIYLQLSTGLNLRKVSGTDVSLGNYVMTPVDGRTYRLRLEARGTTIAGYLDGVLRVVSSDSDLLAETHAGITFFNGAAAPLSRIDNFRVLR